MEIFPRKFKTAVGIARLKNKGLNSLQLVRPVAMGNSVQTLSNCTVMVCEYFEFQRCTGIIHIVHVKFSLFNSIPHLHICLLHK